MYHIPMQPASHVHALYTCATCTVAGNNINGQLIIQTRVNQITRKVQSSDYQIVHCNQQKQTSYKGLLVKKIHTKRL